MQDYLNYQLNYMYLCQCLVIHLGEEYEDVASGCARGAVKVWVVLCSWLGAVLGWVGVGEGLHTSCSIMSLSFALRPSILCSKSSDRW